MFDNLPVDLRPPRAGAARVFPFIVMFLVTWVATLRERTTGTLERLLTMPLGKVDLLLGYALAFGLVAARQASRGRGQRRAARPRRRRAGVAADVVAVADALLGIALGLFSAPSPDGVPGRPVHAAFVLPQVLLCGLFVPRDADARRARGDLHVLPLSYAVDAMQDLTRTTATAASGATSRSSSAFAVAASSSARPPCAAAPPDIPERRTAQSRSLAACPCSASAPAARRAATVKKLVSAAGLGRDRPQLVPGETTEAVVEADRRVVADGLPVTLDYLGEDTPDAEQADATVTAYLDLLEQLAERPDPRRRGLGEAHRDRPGSWRRATATRSRSRTPARSARPPATPARRSPSTWRTTPPPTPRCRSCASCARTSPRPAR